MSVLQAINAGLFQNDPSVIPNLNQVLIESNNATSQNIVSSAAISATNLTASGNITCVDLTSTSDVFASNVTSTGTLTIQKPLLPSYSLFSYPVPAGSVGSIVSVAETVGLPFALTASGAWTYLFTSSTVLPLGIYMFSSEVLFTNPTSTTSNNQIGIVNNNTDTQPAYGTYATSLTVPIYSRFNTCFISSTGFQSPKFYYSCDTESVAISIVTWSATKIG